MMMQADVGLQMMACSTQHRASTDTQCSFDGTPVRVWPPLPVTIMVVINARVCVDKQRLLILLYNTVRFRTDSEANLHLVFPLRSVTDKEVISDGTLKDKKQYKHGD